MQTHYKNMVLNYRKRDNIYKNTTGSLTFDPVKIQAHSYRWWKFVDVVEGKIVFNNYSYSPTTGKHQRKVEALMEQLGIKIDIRLPLPKGIESSSLESLIETAEESLCDKFLRDQLKKQDAYQRTKARKLKKQLEDYLENECHFRDYDIESSSRFGSINKIAVHQKVEKSSLEHDVQNALHSFSRDGFSSIVFYVEGL